jgi:hypothetical protein
MSRWHVTVRHGPRVEKAAATTLEEAIALLEDRTRAAASADGRRGTIDLRVRRYEPGDQVAVRAELRGPGRWRPAVRAGMDVRGDGTLVPWSGRDPIALEDGEGPYEALRRTLQSVKVDP